MPVSEFKTLPFLSPKKFEAWLSKNHKKEPGLWIRFYKKDSKKKSITYAEALDIALCYGWIDGQSKSYNSQSWIQKFTPRRAKSNWSKRNTEHAQRLIKEKRMKPAGLEAIISAKKDGRWEQAYDSPGKATVPKDFLKELSKSKNALKFFKSLNKANLYAITYRLQTAKKPETREKRMKAILEKLKKGERFH